MKQQVRAGVFETNSSSEHSIAIMGKSDYDRWKNGELVARTKGEDIESIRETGNMSSRYYELEFIPSEGKDEKNIEILTQKYYEDMEFIEEVYGTLEEFIEMYKSGDMKGGYHCLRDLYLTYDEFFANGFDGENEETFAHNVNNGEQVLIGSYYHT